MRNYLTSLLLAITLPLGELHTYFSKYEKTVYVDGQYLTLKMEDGKWVEEKKQNWILTEYRPFVFSWNVKYSVDELIVILYFLAWIFYKENRWNRSVIISFLALSIMDGLLYFYNYKLYGFGSVYFWFIGFLLISFFFILKIKKK